LPGVNDNIHCACDADDNAGTPQGEKTWHKNWTWFAIQLSCQRYCNEYRVNVRPAIYELRVAKLYPHHAKVKSDSNYAFFIGLVVC